MSIASQIATMQEHIEDIYDTFAVAGVDTSAAAKNIVNINTNLKERLEYYLANGLDVVWNNWNKISGSGTTLSLNNTIQAKMDFVYKGNTSQSILPSGYTQVDYITSDGNSYIDTGKTLGDNFKIETKFIHNQQSSNEQPIISTWVNSYAWFNLYIASNNQLRFYAAGNHMTANPTLTIGNINTVSYSRNDNEWVGTLNGEEVTFTTEITSSNLTTFKILVRGDGTRGSYVSIYRLKLFENNILTMDLIPCYRNSDNVIGMYDIINNIFYINSGTGNFTYGSIAPNPDCPIPVNVVTGDNTIKVEGKNLFSGYTKGIGINGTTGAETADANAGASDYIPLHVTGDNKYKIWGLPTTISSFVAGYNSKKEFLGRTGGLTLGEFTLAPQFFVGGTPQGTGDIEYIRVHSYKISTSTGTINDIDNAKVMLEAGTTATSYEPYQSQTYPINLGSMELCKIGEYQDVIKRSSGKNIWNEDWEIGAYKWGDGEKTANNSTIRSKDKMPIKSSTTYYLSIPSEIILEFFDENKTFLGSSTNIDKNNSGTFTTPSNAKYFILYTTTTYGTTYKNDIMINEGTTALPYEPYGKVWYKYSAIGKVVLDGSENWQVSNTGTDKYIYYAYNHSVQPISTSGYSNYYPFIAIGGDNTNQGIFAVTDYVRIRYGQEDTIPNFKTWLSTHNTTLYYVLATPTITEITDTTLINQLEAIKLSYNEQTNISQTNTDKPFILDVTALKDLDAEDTTPALTTNRGLLFTQPPVPENSINDEDDNSILEETINEEEPNIEDDNREEEEPVDFFEKEIINNDEEQEEIPTEPIEIDNGQR